CRARPPRRDRRRGRRAARRPQLGGHLGQRPARLRHPRRRHRPRPPGPHRTPARSTDVNHPADAQPPTDPADPRPEAVPAGPEGTSPGDAAGVPPVDPVTEADDEVVAVLEESMEQEDDSRLVPYQAVVLTSFGGPEGPDEVMPF